MNFNIALDALKSGQKIRHKDWYDSAWIQIHKGVVYDEEEDVYDDFDTEQILSDGWEIVQNMSFAEAFEQMRRGNKVRRQIWPEYYIYIEEGHLLSSDIEYVLDVEDYDAEDWILV